MKLSELTGRSSPTILTYFAKRNTGIDPDGGQLAKLGPQRQRYRATNLGSRPFMD